MTTLLLVLLVALATPKVQPLYKCEGDSPQGKYTMPLSVEQHGDSYLFVWAEGQIVGIGLRKENQLAVAFVNQKTGGVGVNLYEVADNQLRGEWNSGGKTYREVCTVGGGSNA